MEASVRHTIRHQVAIDHVLAVAHSRQPVQQSEWETYLALIRKTLEREGRAAVLVSASGEGGPDVNQRASLSALAEFGEVRMAVLTDSAFLRGAVTALKWMNTIEVQVFEPGQEGNAIEYLEITPQQAGRALALMHQLAARCERELVEPGLV